MAGLSDLRYAALAILFALLAAPASALELAIAGLRTPAVVVTATIEVRDVLPERFKRLIDEGMPVHLRVEAELWESRPVWDRLVYPSIVRVFRLVRAAAGGGAIAISDSAGSTQTYPSAPNSMPVALELGNRDRIAASAKYYVHIMATVGTIAERDAEEAGDAVFGRDSDTTGLSAIGRRLFRTVIKVSDYLQSVSAETTSKKTQGSDLLKPQ